MPKPTPESLRAKREIVSRSLQYLLSKKLDKSVLQRESGLLIYYTHQIGTVNWEIPKTTERVSNTTQEQFNIEDQYLDKAISALKKIEEGFKAEQRNELETSSRHSSVSSNASWRSSSSSSSSETQEKKSLLRFYSKNTSPEKNNDKKKSFDYEGMKSTFEIALSNHDDVNKVKTNAKSLKGTPEFEAALKGLSKESLQFAKDLKAIEAKAVSVTEKRVDANNRYGPQK